MRDRYFNQTVQKQLLSNIPQMDMHVSDYYTFNNLRARVLEGFFYGSMTMR